MNSRFLLFGFLISLTLLTVGESLPVLKAGGRPEVVVEQGTLVGIVEVQNEFSLLAFKAIPFAKPPKNELRFMAPQPPDGWEEPRDASTHPKPCPQFVTGVEDCLYLNVYTPETALSSTTGPLPVMVYIHGGAFCLGSARSYDEVYRLVQKDVIVVITQYRLGVLGFFSTGDDAAPGNQGLMDQTKALEWVQKNIAAFGGDPGKVTLFGESAGAASTHYQLLTPFSEGFFRNAIMQSGNAFCPWASGRNFYNVSRTIGERFRCPVVNSTELVACLQNVNFYALNSMYASFIEWNFQPFSFAPRVDGTYIPDEPARLVKEGRFHKVPTMMGTVRDEGALESGEMYAIPSVINSLMSDFSVNGPVSLQLFPDEDPVNTATQVYEYYLGAVDINENNANEVTKMYSDRLFHVHLDWLTQLQADQAEVYMYEFDHRGEWGLMDNYAEIGLNISDAKNWVAHGDDIQYIFQRGGTLNTSEDRLVGHLFSSLFTNFAKYGTPTPDESLLGFLWPPAKSYLLDHLSVSVNPEVVADSRQEERAFWESLPLRINQIINSN